MLRRVSDLALVSALTIAAAITILLPVDNTVLRTIFALPLVHVLPGYALTSVLFSRQTLGLPERVLFSLGLSLALNVLSALILHWTPWGLQTWSWTVVLSSITLGMSALSLLRGEQQVVAAPTPVTAHIGIGQGLMVLLAVLVLGTALGVAGAPAPQQGLQGYTQLWLLPAGDENRDSVRLGVTNMEFAAVTYHLYLQVDGRTVQEWPAIGLKPGEQWEHRANLPSEASGASAVEAVLYRTDDPASAYRRTLLRRDSNN